MGELSRDEFEAKFLELTSGADEVYVALAKLFRNGSEHDGEMTPVGMALAYFSEHRMEVHAYWFPWATARNTLESTVKFIAAVRKKYLVLIFAKPGVKAFYENVSKYGVLRRASKVKGYYGNEDAYLFHSTGLEYADRT